jgi:hypothetical protein
LAQVYPTSSGLTVFTSFSAAMDVDNASTKNNGILKSAGQHLPLAQRTILVRQASSLVDLTPYYVAIEAWLTYC